MELTTEALTVWADKIKQELDLKEFRLYVTKEGDIKLDIISVPKELRKQGLGSKAMEALTKLADEAGKRIILVLGQKDSDWGTTSRGRLEQFYKRFGFVSNRGRHKDFTISDSMYRMPKMKNITFKEFFQHLEEAPLPDDWDKNVYSNRTSFAKQIRYAKERAQQVGAGSSRVAFKIEYQGRPTVLKIAKNPKGLAQNEQESEVLNDWYLKGLNLIIPMIDYDEESPKPTWLHVEFATKAKDSDFKKICGLTLDQTVTFACKMAGKAEAAGWGRALPENLDEDKLMDIEFISDLVNYFGNYDHPLADYRRLANWGIYQGNPVIIDIGLSNDIFKAYYTR